MHDAVEMFDINIISSVCLSWAEAVSENQSDPRENSPFIVMGHRSCGKFPHQINPYWCNQLPIKKKKEDIMKTTSSKCQSNPSLICPTCNFCMRWSCLVIKGCVLKAVLSIDPNELKALRAELGWSILLCTCLLSAGKAICCSGFFPQTINLRKNHSPVVLY